MPNCRKCGLPLTHVLEVDTPEHFAGRYVCGTCDPLQPPPDRLPMAALVADLIAAELERQSNSPGAFTPFVRSEKIGQHQARGALVDGQIDLDALADAILRGLIAEAVTEDSEAAIRDVSGGFKLAAELEGGDFREAISLPEEFIKAATRPSLAVVKVLGKLREGAISPTDDMTLFADGEPVSARALAIDGLLRCFRVEWEGRPAHRWALTKKGEAVASLG